MPRVSVYAQYYVKGSHRAFRTPRIRQKYRPNEISYHGPNPFVRNRFYEIDRWYKARIKTPDRYPLLHIIDFNKPIHQMTLLERLAQGKSVKWNAEVEKPIDIGLPFLKQTAPSTADRRSHAASRHQLESVARRLQLKIDLAELETEVGATSWPRIASLIADHFGIFRDLFHKDAYFHPVIPLTISYDYDDESVSRVFHGNTLMPSETCTEPTVSYCADKESVWTLLMVNPDGNPFTENTDVLHWLVANIPGNDLSKGDTLCDYLQPLPFKGTGWHRIVFVLFKQLNGRIDLSAHRRDSPCNSLQDRSFSTPKFYKAVEDQLTPAGLAFFQSEWDASVVECLQQRLDMKQPIFEFEWPAPTKHAQKEYPEHAQPFNYYLEQYRDVADIEKEMLEERLSRMNPFVVPLPRPEYPNALWDRDRLLTEYWRHDEKRKENLGLGKYRSLYQNKLN